MRTVKASPKASILIESMRDIGYSLETAIADVVDNSITAGATTIQLFADPTIEKASIAIVDNGAGLTEEALLAAMRPGARNPLDERDLSDLGRFGMGLKIASFSQCRKLTVVSRSGGQTSSAIWDLDFVAEKDDWLLQLPRTTKAIPWIAALGETGTLVVWEKLDRLVETADPAKAQENFTRRLDEAREHLELVFHRYLAGDAGTQKIRISLNKRTLKPFNPFHSDHPATVQDPIDLIRLGKHSVSVQAFTLPHHSKVNQNEWDRYAGKAGYLKNQGFYLYREKRLILHGTWFGLMRQTELTKLTRVRIDIRNNLDAEWKIDIKKSFAQPPSQVRDRLRRIIERMGAGSKRVYRSRGRVLTSESQLPVWNRVAAKNAITYKLNYEHAVIDRFKEKLPQDLRVEFSHLLEIIGATIPMDALFADLAGEPEKVSADKVSVESLDHAIINTVTQLHNMGTKETDILMMMQLAEPFKSNWPYAEEAATRLLKTGALNG